MKFLKNSKKAKKPFKLAFIAVVILNVLVFVSFSTVFLSYMFLGTDLLGLNTAIYPSLFDFYFKSIVSVATFGMVNGLTGLAASIVFYVVIALGLFFFVLSFPLIKKKPVAKLFSALSALAFMIAGSAIAPLIVNSAETGFELLYFVPSGSNGLPLMIMTYVILALGGLLFVFMVLKFIVGRAYAKRNYPIPMGEVEGEHEELEIESSMSNEDVSEESKEDSPVEVCEAAQDPVVVVEEPAFEEETVVEDKAIDEVVIPNPVPVFIPEPEPEPVPTNNGIDPKDLAMMIREIVRDEIARNNVNQKPNTSTPGTDNHSVVGATFGGPLIVQYFGTSPIQTEQKSVQTQNVVPVPAPIKEVKEVKEETVTQPKVEEKKVEQPVEKIVEPVVEKKEEPVVEIVSPSPSVVEPVQEVVEVPVTNAAPVEVKEEKAKNPIIRIPFDERMVSADKEMQEHYNLIKNEILSYGVKSRVSSSGDTFRLHRKTYIKLTIAGKSLKLYFALDPENYRNSTIPVGNAGDKASFAEIPLVFKVRSDLSMKRCSELIQTVMEVDALEQGEVGTVNWVKELKADMKEKAKKEKENLKDED